MWIYTHKGFLSIVQDFRNENQVVVRGKFKEDILTYFPQASLAIDSRVDYKFKTSLPKEEVADRLQRYIMSELNLRETRKKAEEKIS